MISYIELRNFKSFSNIFFDLRGSHGIPKKLAFLYGENGSGKSNLIRSLMFMCQSFDTLRNQQMLPDIEKGKLDIIKDEKLKEKLLSEIVRTRLYSLQDLIRQNRSIGESAPMVIKVGFYHEGKDGFYSVKFNTEGSSESVLEEKLYYTLNERAGLMFDISTDGINLSPSSFPDAKYKCELLELIEKYWGKHTFISILYNELQTKNRQYFNARLAPNLQTVLRLLSQISTLYKENHSEAGRIAIPIKFLHQLDKGHIENKNDAELLAVQKFLNQCFTQLFSDIKRAYYKFEASDSGYDYELYFDKVCCEKEIAVPISFESTGTKKILDLFPLIFTSTLGATVFVDEVDSGIHDLLMQDIAKLLQQSLDETEEGQFIATTHNTLLLDDLEPENVYVLKADILGNKEISCIKDYPRTHKNNSIRHRYLTGVYQGIPEVGYLDFKELVDDTMSEIKSDSDLGGDHDAD